MAHKAEKATDRDHVGDPVLDAALAEAAAVGWDNMTFEGIAARAGMTLGQLLIDAPTKSHLMSRYADHVDRVMLEAVESIDDSQSTRDRLFDLLMRRFDTMQKNRAGVLAMGKGLARDPGTVAVMACRLTRSMNATLNAAGAALPGIASVAQVVGLQAVYVSALRTWAEDDTEDMAKTMAALDKALGHAERAVNFVSSRRRKTENVAA